MNIPGANLLNMALSIITPQVVQYFAATGRTTNAAGMRVTSYAPSMDISGSFQPIPRTLNHQLGLDLQADYAMFYSSQLIADVGRDRSGDQIQFAGGRWQAVSANDWTPVDGWNGLLFVKVPVPT